MAIRVAWHTFDEDELVNEDELVIEGEPVIEGELVTEDDLVNEYVPVNTSWYSTFCPKSCRTLSA